jgi:GNAT superfamily N-acetyltransferase
MIVTREDGYQIDSAKERLEVDQVHEWISTDAYWALGRSRELTGRAIAGATCFGIYSPAGPQVGYARVVTDDVTFAWLCDVYVARPARGLGLGTWLAQSIRDYLIDRGLTRLVLATGDAHGVYAKAGFVPLGRPERWMEIDLRGPADPGAVPRVQA